MNPGSLCNSTSGAHKRNPQDSLGCGSSGKVQKKPYQSPFYTLPSDAELKRTNEKTQKFLMHLQLK